MSPSEISNWISIYLATAICCAFAITLTTCSLMAEMIQERFWQQPWDGTRVFLFVPRTWWRWQRRYFLSTPVTLSIVGGFATTLNW
jgi:hypothetical protein